MREHAHMRARLVYAQELERLILAYTPRFQGILEAAREQMRETGGIGHDEFWQEMQAEQP